MADKARAFPTFSSNPLDDTSGTLDAKEFATLIDDKAGWVLNNTPVTLTVGGTGNAITATADPVISAYAADQAFWVVPGSDNTGAVTIAIDGLAARAITDAAGNALTGGELVSGTLYLIKDDGTGLRITSSGGSASDGAGAIDVQEFTASGTWNKPSGTYQWAFILGVGGGASGGRRDSLSNAANLGGGGGAGGIVRVPFASLGSTETVTIGSGGGTTATNSDGIDGGDTSLGSFVTFNGGVGGLDSENISATSSAGSHDHVVNLNSTANITLAAGVYPLILENGQRSSGVFSTYNGTRDGWYPVFQPDTIFAGPGGGLVASSNVDGPNGYTDYVPGGSSGLGGSGGSNGVDSSGYGAGGAGVTSAATEQAGTDGYLQIICS